MKITNLLVSFGIAASVSGASLAEQNFNRIASFPTYHNIVVEEEREQETSAEIIAATADGMTLVYTDGPLAAVGMIDITNPTHPKPAGLMMMDGEPTSVAIVGQTAFVGVNTSTSYDAPSGYLAVIDISSKTVSQRCTLNGQPDSIAAAKDGSFIAVAIENERDEDLNKGMIPQMPAGRLVMIDTLGAGLDCESLRITDLTGLADIGPSDPEPEFVDINALGEIVVSMQENNHMAVVSKEGTVLSHFSAGSVDLINIDATDERGALIFNEMQMGRLREPDAVKWIDDEHFATANEGDYEGGSRGWTIFHKSGAVVYESGTSFEKAIIQIGHYPDKRSDSKGVEPESIEFAIFNDTPFLFVGAERASIVGVYDATNPNKPVLKQLLPSGVGPEGYVTIPERGLLISANEKDLIKDGGARAHVMIYHLQDAPAAYPQLTSAGMDSLTGWGAISGMVAGEDDLVYAVNDSFYSYQPTIFTIDVSTTPAHIVDALPVTRGGRPAQKMDMEGITSDGQGGFWVSSEGRTDRLVPHAIYHINAKGEIIEEIPFSTELLAIEKRFGAEGITRVGNILWIALQREWKDDPANHVKLLSYNIEDKSWGYVHYPKAEPQKGWVGLSEITAYGDYIYVIERDNQIGDSAKTKKLYRIPMSEMRPVPMGGVAPIVKKELVRDLLPDLISTGGYVLDKVEGLAITADGEAFISTDNDGVDDHSGETMFFSIGKL